LSVVAGFYRVRVIDKPTLGPREGDRTVLVPLPSAVARAIDRAVDGLFPLLLRYLAVCVQSGIWRLDVHRCAQSGLAAKPVLDLQVSVADLDVAAPRSMSRWRSSGSLDDRTSKTTCRLVVTTHRTGGPSGTGTGGTPVSNPSTCTADSPARRTSDSPCCFETGFGPTHRRCRRIEFPPLQRSFSNMID
jgi:hypothetical protein